MESLKNLKNQAKDKPIHPIEKANSYKALLLIDTMAKYEWEYASLTSEERGIRSFTIGRKN